MSGGPILVINANSVVSETDNIRAALAATFGQHERIECVSIPENPARIITAEDIAISGERVARLVAARSDAAAFVIACYAQPGLAAARRLTAAPVIGIQDGAVRTAMAGEGRFGVIALSEGAIRRHLQHLETLGATARLAGETALEPGGDDTTLQRLEEAAKRLIGQGAQTIILGCAGLVPHRAPLESVLGISVIDPTIASVSLALAALEG